MSFDLIQKASSASTTGITARAVLSDTTGMDNLLVWIAHVGSNDTVLDTYNNAWELLGTYSNGGAVGSLYQCLNPVTGEDHEFWPSTDGLSPSVFVIGSRGVKLSDPISDIVSSTTGSTSPYSAGSITPDLDDSLLVAFTAHYSLATPALGSGFTYSSNGTNSSGGNHIGGGVGYLLPGDQDPMNPAWTIATDGAHVAVILCLSVETAANTITVQNLPEGVVLQRQKHTEAQARVMAGTFTGDEPTTIEGAIYMDGTDDVVVDWTELDFSVDAPAYSATLSFPVGGDYNYAIRSKDADGNVLATSVRSNGRVACGALFLSAGQSNEKRMFDDFGDEPTPHALTRRYRGSGWEDVAGEGMVTWCNGMREALGIPIGILDYSVPGSGLISNPSLSGQWDSDTAGQPFPELLDGLEEAGGDCEGMRWNQGEADAYAASDGDDWKAALAQRFTDVQSAVDRSAADGEIWLGIQITGQNDDGVSTNDSMDSIRQAQLEAAQEIDGAFVMGSTVPLPLVDDFHVGGPSYVLMANEQIATCLTKMGYAQAACPVIGEPFRYTGSNTVYVPITLGGDATAVIDGSGSTSGIVTGFTLKDSEGVAVSYGSATIEGTNIVIDAEGEAATLSYHSGLQPDVSNAAYDDYYGDETGLALLFGLDVVIDDQPTPGGDDTEIPSSRKWIIKRQDGKMQPTAAIPKDKREGMDVLADFSRVLSEGDEVASILSIEIIDDGNAAPVQSTAFSNLNAAELEEIDEVPAAVRFHITGGTSGKTDRISVQVLTVGGDTPSAPCSVVVGGG